MVLSSSRQTSRYFLENPGILRCLSCVCGNHVYYQDAMTLIYDLQERLHPSQERVYSKTFQLSHDFKHVHLKPSFGGINRREKRRKVAYRESGDCGILPDFLGDFGLIFRRKLKRN